MRKIDPVLHEKLATLINSMGCEFIGCEPTSQSGKTVLRIYIDTATGVTSAECARVSRQVSAMLDVEDPIQSRYTLEVSSPGIDRPLFEIEQYRQYVGSQVRLRLQQPVNQRRQYKGVLQRVEGEQIHLLVEDTGQEVILPFSEIEKANVVGDIHL